MLCIPFSMVVPRLCTIVYKSMGKVAVTFGVFKSNCTYCSNHGKSTQTLKLDCSNIIKMSVYRILTPPCDNKVIRH